MSPRSHPNSIAFKHRNAMDLMTMANLKTPKGEGHGYLTAVLYLSPHTSAGGKTVCAHSNEACRAMCLAGAGLSGLPRQIAAKQRRTALWNTDQAAFLRILMADIERLCAIAKREGMKPVVRLNGTSDIPWERLIPMREIPVQWMDYTKFPLEKRLLGKWSGYHLTYSVGAPEDMPRAIEYLRHGQSVAIVTTEVVKNGLVGLEMDIGGASASFEDGDEHDLRFLDPPASIVLLKPKGRIVSDLVRPNVLNELRIASRVAA